MGELVKINMSLEKNENEILAERVVFRANSGLHFIDQCLSYIHRGGTDAAFSRSLYVLFSYNFELIIKACILLASSQTKREDLVKEIKTHNLEKLLNSLSEKTLGDIGIKSIRKTESSGFVEYIIEMTIGNNIVIQDFVDVRYDFGKDLLRDTDPNEANRMKSEVEIMLGMTKKIMKMLPL